MFCHGFARNLKSVHVIIYFDLIDYVVTDFREIDATAFFELPS